MLSDKQLLDFKNLYKNKYGIELSRDEAYEKAVKLVRIVELVYKPMTAEEFNKYKSKDKNAQEQQAIFNERRKVNGTVYM